MTGTTIPERSVRPLLVASVFFLRRIVGQKARYVLQERANAVIAAPMTAIPTISQ